MSVHRDDDEHVNALVALSTIGAIAVGVIGAVAAVWWCFA